MNTLHVASAAKLLAAVRFFKANPAGQMRVDWCTTWGRAEFERWFFRCLHRKINRHDTRTWRKLSDEWQFSAWKDAQTINAHARGVNCSGRNVLSCPDVIRLYPEINNPACND